MLTFIPTGCSIGMYQSGEGTQSLAITPPVVYESGSVIDFPDGLQLRDSRRPATNAAGQQHIDCTVDLLKRSLARKGGDLLAVNDHEQCAGTAYYGSSEGLFALAVYLEDDVFAHALSMAQRGIAPTSVTVRLFLPTISHDQTHLDWKIDNIEMAGATENLRKIEWASINYSNLAGSVPA